ncbi:MAG: hypothetical protein R2932_16705 [Caldilineaceae bacterium]
MNGFDNTATDVTISGGTVDSITGGPQSYVVTITPSGTGDVSRGHSGCCGPGQRWERKYCRPPQPWSPILHQPLPTITSGNSVSIPETQSW